MREALITVKLCNWQNSFFCSPPFHLEIKLGNSYYSLNTFFLKNTFQKWRGEELFHYYTNTLQRKKVLKEKLSISIIPSYLWTKSNETSKHSSTEKNFRFQTQFSPSIFPEKRKKNSAAVWVGKKHFFFVFPLRVYNRTFILTYIQIFPKKKFFLRNKTVCRWCGATKVWQK